MSPEFDCNHLKGSSSISMIPDSVVPLELDGLVVPIEPTFPNVFQGSLVFIGAVPNVVHVRAGGERVVLLNVVAPF